MSRTRAVEVAAVAAAARKLFGDEDCSGAKDVSDAIKILMHIAGLPVSQTQPCPTIGGAVTVNGSAMIWGDVDCSSSVNVFDAIKNLLYIAGLTYEQAEPCPDIGTVVAISW